MAEGESKMIDNAIILTKEEYENAKNNIRNSAYQQGAREFAEWLYAKANVPIYDYYGRKTKTDDLLSEWQKEKRMKLTQEEARLQDVVEIPDEYFELDHQRKELIDEVIRKLHESQKRGAK